MHGGMLGKVAEIVPLDTIFPAKASLQSFWIFFIM
jgi:hypothetical protein